MRDCIHACLGNVDRARLATFAVNEFPKFNAYTLNFPQTKSWFQTLLRCLWRLVWWYLAMLMCVMWHVVTSCKLYPSAFKFLTCCLWYKFLTSLLLKSGVGWPWTERCSGKPSSFVKMYLHHNVLCCIPEPTCHLPAVSKVLPAFRESPSGRLMRQDPVVHLSPNKQGHVS